MKFNRTYTLSEISKLIDCQYVGNELFPVKGINEIHVVTPGDIVFVDHPKYYDKALNSAATVILIDKKVECPEGKALLISDDPFRDFNKITQHFKPFKSADQLIASTAQIGKNTLLQPNVFIGHDVIIGENCILHPNVTINDNCILGNNVVIQANTVLGSDAFYYKKRPEGYDRLLSGGRVVIEDNVEIGASCTIDRGVSGDTTIKKGTKIDNQVQIAHDTVIGENCLIASHVGIAGCTIVEDEVTLWGQVGVNSAITIGKGAVVLGQSGVTKSLDAGKTYFGYPAMEASKKYRELVGIRTIPKIIEKLKNIY